MACCADFLARVNGVSCLSCSGGPGHPSHHGLLVFPVALVILVIPVVLVIPVFPIIPVVQIVPVESKACVLKKVYHNTVMIMINQ